MLRIGLTGGIGAGKSAVSSTFAEYGAVVIDGDVLAREVVEPGTEGLAALVEAFGAGILAADGSLDRPALAARAFTDDAHRATLNGIVHPLVAARRAEILTATPDDAVVIEDIPLLVESRMAPLFPLVVIVHTDVETRVSRLTGQRGMPEADARARIAAQATDEQRRAAADVWLDNSGTREDLQARIETLWRERIVPFAANLHARRPAPIPDAAVQPDPDWPAHARRIVARLTVACGHRAVSVEHVGPTRDAAEAVPDVIDVAVTVTSPDVLDDLDEVLLPAGYPRIGDDGVHGAHGARYASADPGRPTRLHLRFDEEAG